MLQNQNKPLTDWLVDYIESEMNLNTQSLISDMRVTASLLK